MQIEAAQQDMAAAHVRGAPGVLVSGLVWLIAGGVWTQQGVATGFTALFVGGILIFPASLLISRLVFRAPKASPGNPLERLALESTFVLFAGLFLAWCFLRVAPELAFPAMAVAIGVRYFVFRTVYGNAIYWVLGGALAIVGGLAAIQIVTLPVNTALIVGAVEVCLSVVIFLLGKKAAAAN
ncbi:DUF7010 family protein [Brevundimonas sp. GCM10030266]|uniref:DUF7010 family protein n=1 Tax=Brevundimonas sp. GCM10030266 TaxID=3273386 RepID=UPI00360700F0